MKRLFLSAAALFLLAGCWILPDGDPPEGNILSNPSANRKTFTTPAEAFDYMVTSVTEALLVKCPGASINVSRVDGNYVPMVNAVLRETGKISGNIFTSRTSDWEIVSSSKDQDLNISLIYKGKKVWEENFSLPL